MVLGLTAAAVAGLVSYVAFTLAGSMLQIVLASVAFGFPWEETHFLSTAAFYLFFGLPIAVIRCVSIGLPIWR